MKKTTLLFILFAWVAAVTYGQSIDSTACKQTLAHLNALFTKPMTDTSAAGKIKLVDQAFARFFDKDSVSRNFDRDTTVFAKSAKMEMLQGFLLYYRSFLIQANGRKLQIKRMTTNYLCEPVGDDPELINVIGVFDSTSNCSPRFMFWFTPGNKIMGMTAMASFKH